MRKIEDVIKATPQLQNQDYDTSSMGSYGEGEYYEFEDGSIVMRENELETYLCAKEQEWFWDDFNNELEEEWVYDTVDEGTRFFGDKFQEFTEDLYDNEFGGGTLYSTIYEGDLENGVDESFGASGFSISSGLKFVKDIDIDFADLFDECYSKTEKVFVMINVSDEEDAVIEIASTLGMTIKEEIAFTIEENADLLLNAPKMGEDISQENIKKLLRLIESGKEESIVQGFELASTLDAPNAIDAVLKSSSVKQALAYMPRARTVVQEIIPECWDGTYINDPSYFVSYIIERIGENIDEDKGYTMVSAFMSRDKVDNYLYINENEINWSLCKDLKVSLGGFEETYVISDGRFKKTYKMKDWYIALS